MNPAISTILLLLVTIAVASVVIYGIYSYLIVNESHVSFSNVVVYREGYYPGWIYYLNFRMSCDDPIKYSPDHIKSIKFIVVNKYTGESKTVTVRSWGNGYGYGAVMFHEGWNPILSMMINWNELSNYFSCDTTSSQRVFKFSADVICIFCPSNTFDPYFRSIIITYDDGYTAVMNLPSSVIPVEG